MVKMGRNHLRNWTWFQKTHLLSFAWNFQIQCFSLWISHFCNFQGNLIKYTSWHKMWRSHYRTEHGERSRLCFAWHQGYNPVLIIFSVFATLPSKGMKSPTSNANVTASHLKPCKTRYRKTVSAPSSFLLCLPPPLPCPLPPLLAFNFLLWNVLTG